PSASEMCRTGITRIPSASAGPSSAANTLVHPAARAADNRCSMEGAARTRPVSATSPTNADPAGGATPVAAETSAAATARPEAGSRVSVERQDHVDGVLEGPRAGEVAVLRHVSREQDGDALLFGQTDEGVGAQTHLGGAAGYLGPRRVADGLDRVHRQEERA